MKRPAMHATHPRTGAPVCLLALVTALVDFGCDGATTGTADPAPGAGSPDGSAAAADPPIAVAPTTGAPSAAREGPEVSAGALERARDLLLEELTARGISDARVLDAMRRVPRHEFVPQELRAHSYDNSSLPIAENQTISQPYVVALMSQLLELRGDEKVLEIGTGSGYQAAILGELVPRGEVYTVEIRATLHEKARSKLRELKERGVLRYEKLVAVRGDGSRGYPTAAPYDAIVVTAAPRRLPDELRDQLKPGGRLVVPVGDSVNQELRLFEKREDGTVVDRVIAPAYFVPLERVGSASDG